jgi:hypothetical protein
LQASNGIIGGWTISQYGLTSRSNNTVLSDDGTIEAYKIITKLGKIGNWYITATGLSNKATFNLNSADDDLVALYYDETKGGIIYGATI